MCIKTNSTNMMKAAPVRAPAGMRKRRRTTSSVRFSGEQPHTVMELLPLSSEYSAEEKQLRWMSIEEKEETSRLASMQAKEYRQLDAQREQQSATTCSDDDEFHAPSYRETYNAIFSACHQQQQQAQTEDDDDSSLPVTPQAVALLAVQGIRGLEDRTVPLTALLRRKIRRVAIRQVVQAAQDKKKQTTPEQVAQLYTSLTKPASQFARVLGLADATCVLMEYSNKNNFCLPSDPTAAATKSEQQPLVTEVEPTALKATV